MPFDPSRIPDMLVDAYRLDRCALLIGAGASKGAHLPDWRSLLEGMIVKGVQEKVVTLDRAEQYRAMLARDGKILMAAGGLKADIHSYFDDFIEQTFIAPKPQPTALHLALASLTRAQFYITTNYDTLLERTYRQHRDDDVAVLTFANASEIQRRLSKREFFILKAHGDASNIGEGIILTDTDYRSIIYRQRAYQSLLSMMFTMYTVVFVGASMTDPEIGLLLGFIADAYGPGKGPTHFALMAEAEMNQVERERWFKDLNIQIIPISSADDYAEIPQFLDALRTRVEGAAA